MINFLCDTESFLQQLLQIKFLAAITANHEPENFLEAVRDERWWDVMQKEIQALENNGAEDITDLPSDKKALG